MDQGLSAALYHNRRKRAKQRIGNPPVALANFNPPDGQTSVVYSYQTAQLFIGGTIVSFERIGTLPLGLNLNTTTGEISGTPTTVQTSVDIRIMATNLDGSSTTNKATIVIT